MGKRTVYPPVYFLLALLAMIGVHLTAPRIQLMVAPWTWLGLVGLAVGGTIVGCSAQLFTKHHTTIRPFEESSTLVTGGPFRFSRNPMYLSMVIVLLGVGMLLGSLVPFIVVPLFGWAITTMFIKREEVALERRFGTEFLEYRQRVRRWL